MRFFNTEGPVRPDDHYAIAPLDRVDVDELLSLIRAKQYFVLHAPRQTGKTSALIALSDLLNSAAVARSGGAVKARRPAGTARARRTEADAGGTSAGWSGCCRACGWWSTGTPRGSPILTAHEAGAMVRP